MKLGIIVYPHNNKRYYKSLLMLAKKELVILLGKEVFDNLEEETINGLDLLTFELQTPSKELISKILTHSALFALFEIDGNTLTPMMADHKTYFNDDLSSILKYKGKTNEMFTEMMVNVAIAASDFADSYHQPLNLLDPMCGKATSLFKGLKKGYNTAGVEITKLYYNEMEGYLKRYFQYNKIKYSLNKTSYKIVKDKAQKFTVEVADSNAQFKAGNVRSLQYVQGDTKHCAEYFGKKKFHTIVADLPYGVQHDGKQNGVKSNIINLIDDSLDSWLATLKTGGTIVLAFNAQTLKRERLVTLFNNVNLEIVDGAPYDDFSHWVEQSITRDIIIAKKTNLPVIEAF